MNESAAQGILDPAVREQVNHGIDTLDLVMESATYLQGKPDTGWQIHSIAIHATIVELFAGCLVLAQQQHSLGIPMLLRSMYEALVDLDNLCRDPSYVDVMATANLKQMIKLLEASAHNPLLQGIFDGRRRGELDKMRLAFNDLKSAGHHRALLFEKRCELAGRTDEYESLYGLFCLDVHNNAAAIAERHLEETEDRAVEITFFRKPPPQTIVRRLHFGEGFLVQSATLVHRALRTNAPKLGELEARHYAAQVAVGQASASS